MDNEYDQQIVIRQCSEPSEPVKEIYATLDYKSKPFSRKKSVVPLYEFQNTKTHEKPIFSSA